MSIKAEKYSIETKKEEEKDKRSKKMKIFLLILEIGLIILSIIGIYVFLPYYILIGGAF